MKRNDIIKLAILAIIITGGLVFYFMSGLSSMSPTDIIEWIAGFGIYAAIIFIALYSVAPVLLIPGSILSLSAGALFGPALGTLYVLIGASIGAILAFIVARYFGHAIQDKLAQAKALNFGKLSNRMAQNGFIVVLFLRLIPLFPYSLLNYALALTKVSIRQYVIATPIGMIPGIFAYVYLGSNVHNIGSIEFWIAICVFAIFAGVPLLLRKKIQSWVGTGDEHDRPH